MKNTKENVVKLLKVRRESFIVMANLYNERGDEKEARRYVNKLCECDAIITMLTNQNGFDEYYRIWKEELEEQEQCQKKTSS